MIVLIVIAGSLISAYLLVLFFLKRRLVIHRITFKSFEDLTNNPDPLVSDERFLRKTAFEQVSMSRPETFYTDEDLDAPFDFIVVRDRKSKTPLLSSRSYTDHSLILKQLSGHEPGNYLELSLVSSENYVLLDRLSANAANPFFAKMRRNIFINYYIRVLKSYPEHHIILMARSSNDERLLTKYLRLGFHVIGKQKHNQVDHWILILSARNRTQVLAQSAKQYLLFKLFA